MDHYVFSAAVLVLLYSGAVLGPHVREAWQITFARKTRLSRCGIPRDYVPRAGVTRLRWRR
jgi:hypothetical protein